MGYIQPSERFALWEMAGTSLPTLCRTSIHFHRSSKCQDSRAEKDISGTFAQLRKNTLRKAHWDVYSYEQKAMNSSDSLFSSAILTLSFQIVPATSRLMNALIGGLVTTVSKKMLLP